VDIRFLGGDHSKLFPESPRTTFRAKASRKSPEFLSQRGFRDWEVDHGSINHHREAHVGGGLGEIALRVNNLVCSSVIPK
jgi:hypothetical protein